MANGFVRTALQRPSKLEQRADTELNRWSVLIGALVIAIWAAAVWFLSPKGETQMYADTSLPRNLKQRKTMYSWRKPIEENNRRGQ